MINPSIRFIFPIFCLLISLGCNRENFTGDEDFRLAFSVDTVTFDTVFTTIGSATLSFKVYNPGKKHVRINSIELAGGSSSFFRLNIDGQPAHSISQAEIPPDDSLFIFIAVTIDPTNSDNPMVIKDSLIFNTNGNFQDVKLIAYGQDVHLINGRIITTENWTSDKPYLIYNSMAVDTGQTLTIGPGTQIFFHRNSSMVIWGKLLVNGTYEQPVVFQHDRLEEFYDIIAGQWGTIYIDPISNGNVINHAIIKNSIAGIQLGFPSDYNVPGLELANSFITNVSFAGIYAFGANLTCYNTVFADCAGAAVALLRGGSYRFLHCTISNNGVLGSARTSPSVVLSNIFYNPEFDETSGNYIYVPRAGDLQEATFGNCIIYGNLNHEFQFADNGSNLFNYRFDHCLVKAVEDSINVDDNEHFNSIFFNNDPEFVNDSNRYHLSFALDTLSPAKDSGSILITTLSPFLENDITGENRTGDGKPDLGAFERKEE